MRKSGALEGQERFGEGGTAEKKWKRGRGRKGEMHNIWAGGRKKAMIIGMIDNKKTKERENRI